MTPPKDNPYVYGLTDPGGNLFYIGKGRRDRCFEHVREAKRGKPGPKCDRIREILSQGCDVGYVLFGVFDSDVAAAEEEIRLIAEHGSDGSLTNRSRGGELGGGEGVARYFAIKRAKELLARLMPYEKWVKSLSEEKKTLLLSISGGETLWDIWSWDYNSLLRETMDPQPRWATQMPDGTVKFTFCEPPSKLPMPKWTKVYDGSTGEWSIRYG